MDDCKLMKLGDVVDEKLLEREDVTVFNDTFLGKREIKSVDGRHRMRDVNDRTWHGHEGEKVFVCFEED